MVFWGSDSWSDVRGDESMLGVQRFARSGNKLVLLLRLDFKSSVRPCEQQESIKGLGSGSLNDAHRSYTNFNVEFKVEI